MPRPKESDSKLREASLHAQVRAVAALLSKRPGMGLPGLRRPIRACLRTRPRPTSNDGSACVADVGASGRAS